MPQLEKNPRGRKRQTLRTQASTTHACLLTVRVGSDPVFRLPRRQKELSPKCPSPVDKDARGLEARSFTSCSSRPSPRSFLFLLLRSSPGGQSRPARHLRPDLPSGNQHFRTKAGKGTAQPDHTPRPKPEKPAALLASHARFQVPTRPRPAPHPQDTDSTVRGLHRVRP